MNKIYSALGCVATFFVGMLVGDATLSPVIGVMLGVVIFSTIVTLNKDCESIVEG